MLGLANQAKLTISINKPTVVNPKWNRLCFPLRTILRIANFIKLGGGKRLDDCLLLSISLGILKSPFQPEPFQLPAATIRG